MRFNETSLLSLPLFKILSIGYLFFFGSVLLVASILALLGIHPATFNEQEFYGLVGFLIHVLSIPFMTLIFTIINWLVLKAGLWLYSKLAILWNQKRNEGASESA